LILIFSEEANASLQVTREVERAVNRGIPIILLRVEDAKPSIAMNYFLSAPHWYDVRTPPLEEHLHKVATKVQAMLAANEKTNTIASKRKKKLAFQKSGNSPLPETREPSVIVSAWGPPKPRMPTKKEMKASERAAKADQVHFSVTSPPDIKIGDSFVVDVWAFQEKHRKAVIKRALEGVIEHDLMVKSKGPILLARGGILVVRLIMGGLVIDDHEDIILWDGDIGNATFLVRVPTDIKLGSADGIVTIQMNGLQIARLYFVVKIGKRVSKVSQIRTEEKLHKSAFVSYASADRDEVLPRIQGIQKVAPELKIFMDVLSLRSGEDWANRLWDVIPQNDIFYLFWSDNARKSEWVEKEWRCALKTRGLDFIDPVPLVSPELVPPPPELASKYFGDWILSFAGDRASKRAH
jgi:hypothetical protein